MNEIAITTTADDSIIQSIEEDSSVPNITIAINSTGSTAFSVSISLTVQIQNLENALYSTDSYDRGFTVSIEVFDSSNAVIASDNVYDAVTVVGAFLDITYSYSSSGGSDSDLVECDDSVVTEVYTIARSSGSTQNPQQILVSQSSTN